MAARLAPLLAIVLLAACGPDNAFTQSESGTSSDTGEPEPLEPACELVWEWQQLVDAEHPVVSFAGLDIDADGNTYVLGEAPSEPGVWVGKWDSDGTQVWARWFDEKESAADLRVGLAGEVFVLGTRIDDLGWTLALRRIDPSTGDELWTVSVPDIYAADLARTADGQILLLGRVYSGTESIPWISSRDPSDGSEVWTRNDPVDLGLDYHPSDFSAISTSESGEIRVAGCYGFNEWPGDFSPMSGGLLLRYDSLGQLLASYQSEAGDWHQPLFVDGSRDMYFDYSPYVWSEGEPALESHADNYGVRWVVEAPAWTVGDGSRDLTTLSLRGQTLSIAGNITDFPEGGGPIWTASVDRDSGELTRGCVHMAEDPESGAALQQAIYASVSHPSGGFVGVGFQWAGTTWTDGPQWIWLRHFAP